MGGKRTHFVPVENAPTRALSDRARELLALALCGASLYVLLCFATFRAASALDEPPLTSGGYNLGGIFGYTIASGFVFVLGFAAWVPFLALLGYAIALFLHRTVERLVVKALGTLVFAAMLALLLDGFGLEGHTLLSPQGAGGAFGANLSPKLQHVFGGPGRLLLVVFGALVSFLLVTEWLFSTALLRAAAALERLWRRMWRLPAVAPAGAQVVTAELFATATAPHPAGTRMAATGAAGDDDEDEDEDEDADDDDGTLDEDAVARATVDADDDENDDDSDGDGGRRGKAGGRAK